MNSQQATDQGSNVSNNILLSICIPTYNRAQILSRTLQSIVNQNGFDNRCEIVISDNNSFDNTYSVVQEFLAKYSNIRYHRNSFTCKADMNFIVVANLARGRFIKLLNDNKEFLRGSLNILLNIAENDECSVAFALHTPNPNKPKLIPCHSFDDFIREVGYQSPWLASVMLRRSLFQELDNKERAVDAQLAQTDIMFRILRKDNRSLVINEKLFSEIPIKYRGGYKFIDVHLNNYLALYEEYLRDGLLTQKTYEEDKVTLMNMILIRWYALTVFKHKYFSYSLEGANKGIIKHYGRSYFLFIFPSKMALFLIKTFIKKTKEFFINLVVSTPFF